MSVTISLPCQGKCDLITHLVASSLLWDDHICVAFVTYKIINNKKILLNEAEYHLKNDGDQLGCYDTLWDPI